MARLSVEFSTLALRNPIFSASGTFGHGLEMQHIVPPTLLGGLVSKTVTLKPRPGNPLPRICETEAGFLNSIGLENRGVEAYRRDVLPAMARAGTCVITNIGGEKVEDFEELARILDGEDAIHAFEVNLSCPNVQEGKLPFATDPKMAARVIERVRAATRKPVLAKLSPNVSRLSDLAIAVEAGGAHGITAVNTVLGMKIDWRTRAPGLFTVQGGYSGMAIKPIALRCAWECARSVKIPVMGCGGITCAADVLEFLVAGCSAVQVGTASFSDPATLARLPGELDALLESAGISDVRELIGSLRIPRLPSPSEKVAPAPANTARGPREGVDAANALGGAASS
ncbi:MAG: dihydroorotate dehydrogenase [Planctomycetes bacterium]|nr:dihydroorotate dehydrogenase [Planctomycetota bacterium]